MGIQFNNDYQLKILNNQQNQNNQLPVEQNEENKQNDMQVYNQVDGRRILDLMAMQSVDSVNNVIGQGK